VSPFAREIEELGRRFAQRLDGTLPSPRDFVGSAAALLREFLAAGWGFEPLVELVERRLPSQDRVNTSFGEPALTLFLHDDFRIDALCWRQGATSIHHHGFSGAFGLLTGTSLHRAFAFAGVRPTASADVELLEGLSEQVTVLREGDVWPIEEGPGFVHQVTHLESPAVTLVIRSHQALAGAVEWSYLPPGVRVAAREGVPGAAQQARFFRFLRAVRPERALEFAATALAAEDTYAVLEMLRVVGQGDRDFETTRRLGEAVGAPRQLVGSVVHEASRERVAAAMKGARAAVARKVLGVFCTATDFAARRRLLAELAVEDAAPAAARVFGELLLGAAPDRERKAAFEQDLAAYFAAAPAAGDRAAPAPHVAETLKSVGFGPCVLGRLE
jgi:hypothetical protein